MERVIVICGLVFAALLPACIEKSADYGDCLDIEYARCDLRDSCPIKDFDQKYCQEYAHEHCRTREIAAEDVKKDEVQACVDAILLVDCTVIMSETNELESTVDETEQIPECWFIEADSQDTGTGDEPPGGMQPAP